jgi:CRISPR-associated protein Cas1
MPQPVVHATAHEDADLIPVRMCNELVYCPRLFHLEHVQGVFVQSADTIEGSGQHERARKRGVRLRVVDDTPVDPAVVDQLFALLPRRMTLASDRLGIRGEIDLVEVGHDEVVVVEAKHGRGPLRDDHAWGDHQLPYKAWPADVAQAVLYIALLRDHGLPCSEARIVYRASRESVTIPFTPELERFAHAVIAHARSVARDAHPPAPLLDSPKCPRCSLHEVCLPDEHYALLAEQNQLAQHATESEVARHGDTGKPAPIRKIVASADERAVVHVLTPGSTVRKEGEALVVTDRSGAADRFVLHDVAHLALFGPVHVTQPCLTYLLREGVAVSHHSAAGRLLGVTTPLGTRNIGLRRAQFRVADEPAACLEIARAIVIAKIRNQRTVLRRHRRGLSVVTDEVLGGAMPQWAGGADSELESSERDAQSAVALALRRMHQSHRAAHEAADLDTLRGHEGSAAAEYFEAMPQLLPRAWQGDFVGRSRRPPRDRVNALLSFGYALLVRDAVAACGRVGLDPMLGVFHTMIPGRPALALDVIEPFRAAWVDTAVLRLVGTGGIARQEFHVSAAGVELSDGGRRAMIRAYERRAEEQTTHPRFGYRMTYRRLLELEVRILAKVFLGELDKYTPLWTR